MGPWKSFPCPDNLILMCEEESHVAGSGYPCSSLLQVTVPQWFSLDALTHLYSDMSDAASSVCTKQMKKLLVAKLPTSARQTLTKGCNLLLSKALVLKLHHPNSFFQLPLNISPWKYLSLPGQGCSPLWQGYRLPLGLQSRQHGVLMVHSGHLPPSCLSSCCLSLSLEGRHKRKLHFSLCIRPKCVFDEQSLSVKTVTTQLVQGGGWEGC